MGTNYLQFDYFVPTYRSAVLKGLITSTYYCLVKNKKQKKTMTASPVLVHALVMALRVRLCCHSSWPPHRLSPFRPLLCTCSRCHSPPVGSYSPPSLKTKCSRTCGSDLRKQKFSRRVSSVHLFPARRRSVALLPRRRIQPPTGAIDCTVVWPVVAPASAHGHPD